jgi:DNA primase
MELSLLERLIDEDFGFEENGGKWGRAKEHNSLVVNRESQTFFWNSQDIKGDVYVYLTEVRNLPPQEAIQYLKQTKVFTGTFIHEIKNGEEVITYPKLVDVFHQNLLEGDKSYFYKRTITDETIIRYRLGMYKEFYTIPIYQDNTFKQFQLRRDNPKVIRNYYKGVGPLLFNSDILKITNKIFLVEGPTSCLVVNQNGIPCVSMNTGAEGFLVEWYSYFLGQKEIYILFDNDPAGKKGAMRTAKILGEYKCKLYNFEEYDEHFDANDFFIMGGTKDEFLDLVYTKSKYIFELDNYKDKKNGRMRF